MLRLVAFVGVFLSLSGCDGGHELFVQVRTDYVPGIEFERVRTSILDTSRADVVFDVETGDSFVEPRRVADIGDVSEQITLEVSLEGADTIARRVVRAQVSESLGVTVVITRDCEGVVCGDSTLPTCHGGRCTDDRCTEESAEVCPEAEGTFDGDCMGGASCARALCTSGTCLLAGDDASCATTEYCDPVAGCMPLPGTVVDSGVPDTCTPVEEVCGGGDEDCDGRVDEGEVCAPVCDPGFGDCDGVSSNGCEARLDTVTNCGECEASCPDGASCVEGGCTIPPWVLTFGGANDDGAFAVARDRFDGVFIAGTYEDSLDFGEGPLADTGTANGFVARLRTSGALDWAVGFDAGGGAHEVHAITVDFVGNVFVGGGYTATSRFGDMSVTNAGGLDAFVVSFDGEGRHRWTRNYGSTGDDLVRGLSVAEDFVLATGHFEDSVDFGGGVRTSLGAQDVFILRLTSDGTHHASFAHGGPGQDSAYAIAADEPGNIYVTGGFESSLTFGAPTLMASGAEQDIFVASVDADGAHRWSNRYGGADSDVGRDLVLDLPAIMVVGSVGAGADLGGGVRTAGGGTDFFLARYTASDGVPVSDFVRGGSGVDQAHAVTPFEKGSVLLAGQVEGSVDFGGGVRPGAGGSEAFVAGYGVAGASLSSRVFSGPSNDEAWDVATQGGEIFLVGRFEGTVDFGAGPVTADGFDLFVVHMTP